MHTAIAEVPRLVRDLYKVVSRLEELFNNTNRKFTPDGHLVGSIGEVLAAYMYDLTLHPASHPLHDAISQDGLEVQIKATQGKKVGLRGEPTYLVVLRIEKNGLPTVVYNGPGKCAWDACGPMQKNGQRSISLSKLGELMSLAATADFKKLRQVRQLP